VPLSDHEEQLLSQMEQQLLQDDPKFASTMRGSSRGPRAGQRMVLGGLAVVAGLALLVLAVTSQIIWLAIPGFLVMLGGATYAFSRPKVPASGPVGVVGEDGSTRPRRGGRSSSGGRGLMERLEERWERRRGQWR
jgi:hypothetical protein